MTSVLTLVRHGQTRANAEGRWEGRVDGPLTPEGRRQVEALGHRLKTMGAYAVVYASPLGRAVETAQLVLASLPAVDPGGLAAEEKTISRPARSTELRAARRQGGPGG